MGEEETDGDELDEDQSTNLKTFDTFDLNASPLFKFFDDLEVSKSILLSSLIESSIKDVE